MAGQAKEKPPATISGAGEVKIPGFKQETKIIIPPERQGKGFSEWLEQQKGEGVEVEKHPDGAVVITTPRSR